jgi:uncharacterized protein YbjQ (UPF0145 family)
MEQLLLFLILITLGYISGSLVEKRHYRLIKEKEKNLLTLPAVTFKTIDEEYKVRDAWLVIGSVVVSIDYFKRLLAILRNIVGGEVKSYESLIDRARREAVIRMKEQAAGADLILNLRVETSVIGQQANRKGAIGSVEAIAYGTAVTLEKQ